MFDRFFNTASLWLVFMIGFLITGLMAFSLFYWMPAGAENNPFTIPVCLKIGIAFGLVFGALWTMIVKNMRLNRKFWDYAEHVRGLVDLATTKEELLSVERDEWQELMKLQLGGPHHASELREIYAIMKTKYSFL
jgi:hypothetical protein